MEFIKLKNEKGSYEFYIKKELIDSFEETNKKILVTFVMNEYSKILNKTKIQKYIAFYMGSLEELKKELS